MSRDIGEILEEIIANQIDRENFYSVLGKAVNVDEDARTCDLEPIEANAPRAGIRLQAAESGTTGIVLIPKEGSFIVASFFDRTTGFVSLTSELEKILIDTDLVQYNGGTNGGLINIDDLVTQMNKAQNDLNSLKTALSGWIPVPNDGGAALKVALANFIADTLTPTLATDMEDDKVTH